MANLILPNSIHILRTVVLDYGELLAYWFTLHVIFRKEWYRGTGKEVMEGRPLLHRLLGSILKDVEFV